MKEFPHSGRAALFLLAALALAALDLKARAAQAPPDKPEDLPEILKAQPLKPAPEDNELQRLLKDRYNAALQATQARLQEFLAGRAVIDVLLGQAGQVLTSELGLHGAPLERARVHEKYFQLARDIEKVAKARYDAGRMGIADYEQARYFRLDAEIQLLRARQEAEAIKPK
jgi:hypothetical protein